MFRVSIRTCVALILLTLFAASCARRQPPVARPMPTPNLTSEAPEAPTPSGPPPTSRVEETPVRESEVVAQEEGLSSRDLEDLNRNSPLQPVFYALDSSELDETGRAVVTSNAQILKKYPSWAITIEGHCDERGTAEYNLALGELRAIAAKNYLVSLGIAPTRILTVSYGKEFPFDAGHHDDAWAKNRRAHFVITSK
jgi:peptidoglycan-associated lipoprotein